METKRKISELNDVAEELNEVCGCKPAIKVAKPAKGKKAPTKKQKETLVAEIIEGAECIVLDEDEGDFSDETIEILKELECWPSEEEEEVEEVEEEVEEEEEIEEKPKSKKGKGEKAPKVEETEEEEDEEVSLEDKLKKAKKMDDLKALVEDYPAEFKKAKKAIKAANNPIKLKKAMRDALGIVPAEKPAKKEKGNKLISANNMVSVEVVKNPKISLDELEKICRELGHNTSRSSLSKYKKRVDYVLNLVNKK